MEKTVASATSNNIQKLCNVSKNTLYRALLNERINWRMFLTQITLRFHAILQERQVNTDTNEICAILDDTTFQKTGIRIEGIRIHHLDLLHDEVVRGLWITRDRIYTSYP